MSQVLMEGVEVEAPPRKGLGILDVALPAPQGWGQGLSIPFYGCGEPQLVDRCVSANDVPHRTGVAEFFPFGIQQGASCSSLSRLDQKAHARGRLDSTTEWAVGQQFATDGLGLGTPSLAEGESYGSVADYDFVKAVATLEQVAANTGFGTQWWLHAPPAAAAYLVRDRLMIDGLSPCGMPWVISPGYMLPDATTARIAATGPLWAAVDDPFVFGGLDRRNNEDEAYAQRSAIVAFDPCINIHIDITDVVHGKP